MEKRIHLDRNIYLVISLYKPNFESGCLVESAQILRIETRELNGVAYEIKSSIHGAGNNDSSVHYAKFPCKRATSKAIETAFKNLLTHEYALTTKAKERLHAIEL